MKLVCPQSELSTHLSLVSRAVSSRPSHPVLANVLLNADEEKQLVSLSAFDLSLGIQTSFPAQVEVGGRLTLPAKLLGDIVSRLPSGDIVLDDAAGDPEAGILTTLTYASGKYQMRGLAADDFPELPIVEEGDVAQLSAEALIEGLRSSLFSASSDETKQVLTGVHLSLQAEGLEFASTDGHRLAVVQTVNQQDSGEDTPKIDVTIPAKALQELIKMLERGSSATVTVKFDQGQVVFEWADQRLTSRLLEAQYPNYRQLIPRSFSHQMTIDRRSLLGGLERISVIADQRNNIVKLSINSHQQSVTLSVDAQDVGSGRETIAAQITGEDLEVAFNVKYLIDGLKVLNTTDVQMQLNTSTSPVILSPLGNLKMTYLVMPVQVRG
ncbi:DNA polymerase III subunit beta [Alkalinema sp. FACHB-956]|uniref:DNA polymerase III subunit beta n=1 Tax=Alkalinema sp. FACHB-956 TaxID=2692768 RepID=UPI001686B21E|nr:DNA polymerase III subunit beta [Alkalinema sp. FACHB-956]MBD2327136.1 DNA polymerase III subunit beta [Alkalinema sp. FACHB-956]